MASVNFPLTFSLAPIPTGEGLDANAFGQQLVANLQAFISGNFLTGQIGGTQPTQNVGPWLNGNTWWFWDPITAQYLPQTLASTLPAGSILAFGGISAPSGYLLCDGSSYLISAQTALFNAIGTAYGTSGGGTFRVPDYRGRVLLGAGSGSGLTPRSIAAKLGEETHLLSVAELASHNHIQNAHAHADAGHGHTDTGHQHFDNGHAHGISDPGHVHGYTNAVLSAPGSSVQGGSTFQAGTAATNPSGTGIGINTGFASITVGHAAITTGFAAIENATAINNAAGGNTTHNNIQPSLVASYIIKN